jgi:hypothetical protein
VEENARDRSQLVTIIALIVMASKRSPGIQNMAKTKFKEDTQAAADRSPRQITHEEIAQRAYALYVGRGGEDGHDLHDWLQAERELQQENRSSIAPGGENSHDLDDWLKAERQLQEENRSSVRRRSSGQKRSTI